MKFAFTINRILVILDSTDNCVKYISSSFRSHKTDP